MIKTLFLTAAALLIFSAFAPAQTPTPTPKASKTAAARGPIFRPTKDQIKQVQSMLKDKKLYTGEADGKYNDDTRTGIKSFQKDNGLKQTGTLNRATLEKFGVALTDTQKAIPVSANSFDDGKTPAKTKKTKSTNSSTATGDGPKRPAPFRANATQIKAAQKILRDGKMLTGGEDGKLDDATRAGLEQYQKANGLKESGSLNAATLTKMGIELTDAQKANVAAQAAYDAAKTPKN